MDFASEYFMNRNTSGDGKGIRNISFGDDRLLISKLVLIHWPTIELLVLDPIGLAAKFTRKLKNPKPTYSQQGRLHSFLNHIKLHGENRVMER